MEVTNNALSYYVNYESAPTARLVWGEWINYKGAAGARRLVLNLMQISFSKSWASLMPLSYSYGI